MSFSLRLRVFALNLFSFLSRICGLKTRPTFVKIHLLHGGELDSTLKAETVLQAVAPDHNKTGTAITAKNNQPALLDIYDFICRSHDFYRDPEHHEQC